MLLEMNRDMLRLNDLIAGGRSAYHDSLFYKTADHLVKLICEPATGSKLFTHLKPYSPQLRALEGTKATQVYSQIGAIVKHFQSKFNSTEDPKSR